MIRRPGRPLCGQRDDRRNRDRGATAVEYALAVSVFVLGALGGVEVLEDATESEYSSSASGIEALPGNNGFGGGGTPATTAVTTPQTTTTVVDGGPPTTSGGTTTTTASGGTTTTTVSGSTTISTVSDVSVGLNGTRWDARAEVQLRVTETQDPVAGAIVQVDLEAANGSSTSRSCTTTGVGVCVVEWTNLRNKHDPALATVIDVAATPAWDGFVVTANLSKP